MNTIEIIAQTNKTLTASIFPIGSDTAIATGVGLTEYANTKSVYHGTFSSTATGNHRVVVFDSTDPIGITNITLSGANTDFIYASSVSIDFAETNNALANITSIITDVYDRIVFQVPNGPAVVIPAPSSANTTLAWAYCYDENDKPTGNTVITLKLVEATASTKKGSYLSQEFTAISNQYGIAATEIPKGTMFKFRVKSGTNGAWIEFRGTNEEQLELPFLINK